MNGCFTSLFSSSFFLNLTRLQFCTGCVLYKARLIHAIDTVSVGLLGWGVGKRGDDAIYAL